MYFVFLLDDLVSFTTFVPRHIRLSNNTCELYSWRTRLEAWSWHRLLTSAIPGQFRGSATKLGHDPLQHFFQFIILYVQVPYSFVLVLQ